MAENLIGIVDPFHFGLGDRPDPLYQLRGPALK
jgi:hypothetical protein